MDNCKNCTTAITGKYCSNCGQPAQLKRIDAHYILHEIEHVLHFERGILYTMRELLLQPGKNIRAYLSENRSRLVKPILFIVMSSVIYTLVSHFFHIEDGYINYTEVKESSITVMFGWIQSHYGYANIIMGVFIAGWLKLFFRKYNYNLFEIVILLCFLIGMGMLMLTLGALIEGITKISMMKSFTVVIIAYTVWAIGQFFDKKKPLSYIKAFFSYMLGLLTFGIAIVFLGIAIDLIFKK